MGLLRSEEEVDAMIAEMISRTKGNYITQGVTFNKTSPKQMELLKNVLLSSTSFASFVRELIAVRFSENKTSGNDLSGSGVGNHLQVGTVPIPPIQSVKRDTGNFT